MKKQKQIGHFSVTFLVTWKNNQWFTLGLLGVIFVYGLKQRELQYHVSLFRGWDRSSVAEHIPCIYKALGQIPNTRKEKLDFMENSIAAVPIVTSQKARKTA